MSTELQIVEQKIRALQQRMGPHNRVMPATREDSKDLIRIFTEIRTQIIDLRQEHRTFLASKLGEEMGATVKTFLKRVEDRLREFKSMKRLSPKEGDNQRLISARLTFKLRNVIRTAEADGRATLRGDEKLCLERVEKILTDLGYNLPGLDRLLEHKTEDA